MGFLLGRRHGAGYHAALNDVVIDPMGLTNLGFVGGENAAVGFRAGQSVPSWSTDDAMAGAGALWGSLQDFERVTRIVLGLTESDLRQPPQAWKTVVVHDAHGFEVSRAWHVGRADGYPIFWHNGGTGGFWSFYGFRPDTGAAIAMLVAGDTDPTDEGLRFLDHEFRAPKQADVDEQIVGRYQLTADFFIGVYLDQGLPFAQPTGQRAWPLSRLGNDWFAFDEVDASIQFVRSGPAVTGLQLVQNGVVQNADKVEGASVHVRPTAIDLPLSLLQQYVGEYELAAGLRLTVKAAEGALVVGLTGQSFYPVFAAREDHFFYEVVDAQLQFERNDVGDVVALILLQGGVEQRAQRLSMIHR